MQRSSFFVILISVINWLSHGLGVLVSNVSFFHFVLFFAGSRAHTGSWRKAFARDKIPVELVGTEKILGGVARWSGAARLDRFLTSSDWNFTGGLPEVERTGRRRGARFCRGIWSPFSRSVSYPFIIIEHIGLSHRSAIIAEIPPRRQTSLGAGEPPTWDGPLLIVSTSIALTWRSL